ncbi:MULTISPECIES: tetratricopeptide repeat protein [unclassified Psychrobacter]|uniref:tetratricopeptide repeat protein n=1 Tax=unclassified Psychrobacter TaxID=196806 RepID=UPI003F461785
MLATPNATLAKIPKTSLGYMAEGYWQDFIADRPIAGGIAYEKQLHECQLDESLASLQRVDTLILQIRRDITKAKDQSEGLGEVALLADERYRNLLLFLAFYAGRVLARQWQSEPHWYEQFELKKHFDTLPLIAEDFYQSMAVVYSNNSNDSADIFFALEPMGLRLFGYIDRQFQAVQGGQVASGLYQAVSARLPKNNGIDESVTAEPNVEHYSESVDVNPRLIDDENFQSQRLPVQATEHREIPVTKLAVAQQAVPSIVDVAASVKPKISEMPTNFSATTTQLQTVSPLKVSITPEIFTQLLIELDEIEVPQATGHDDYLQACKILDQFEHHIARQNKPRDQVTFSEHHQAARQQALIRLQNSAESGNTTAMLRLAMYELLGEGQIADAEASKVVGTDWVKQAANSKDVRAQRLLSKMYYQGIGVPQEVSSGQYWLEEAAKNGHTEAADLVAKWQQAQTLITSQKQEQHSIKRYQVLVGVVVLGAILLIVFI